MFRYKKQLFDKVNAYIKKSQEKEKNKDKEVTIMAIFGKKDKEKNNEKDTPVTPAAEAPKAPETNAAPKAPEFTAAEAPAVQDAPAKPKYQTPEGFDFNRYFLAERRVVLAPI